mgnify:CR=1 FL=1
MRLLPAAWLWMASFTALAVPSPAVQHVAAPRIVAAARAQIDGRLGGELVSANVVVVGTPADVVVPSGSVTLKLHAFAGKWPRSRIGVPVDIAVDGRVVRAVTVWFALELQREVLGYAADATAGTVGTSLKLVPQQVDVAAVQGNLIRDPHELDGLRLRHAVLAGSTARAEDFERIPDVDRQQRVKVVVMLGAIRMQARGTAIGKGNTGSVVAVLVDNAEAPVRARVTDKGAVEVVQ